MKIRLSLTQKFLAPTLIVLAFVGVILNYQVNSILKREAIEGAKDIIADFIRIHSKRHVTSPSYFSLENPEKTNQIFSELFFNLSV